MRSDFQSLLAVRGVLLADGGTGTGLFARGLATGEAPELWNLAYPDRVEDLHREFVEAGSDLILTNSFGANRRRLALHGAAGRVDEICREAAARARAVADAAPRPVVVAGSMGPTGDILEPLGPLSLGEAVEVFAEQAVALAAGGVDLLWIETMSSAEELRAAVSGAARSGLPVAATMSFDTGGRTMMGLTPGDLAHLVRDLPVRLVAWGANCGTGPAQMLASLLEMRQEAGSRDVLVAKANAGVPSWEEGRIRYSGTPELMGIFARLARAAGARVIGGCCGTTGEHLREMRRALDQPAVDPVPDLATVERLIGPVAVAATGERPEGGRRRRRPA
ncbi:Bifunctional homocysteine S-methyltransferase/5,10-methylenetetrahydrofolate reductase [bacterium HR40]|nr:Bifunctional homocysteine S-methyltransferase/5,10-methylenetetrahydrofolate reductase [bacterium HR40]